MQPGPQALSPFNASPSPPHLPRNATHNQILPTEPTLSLQHIRERLMQLLRAIYKAVMENLHHDELGATAGAADFSAIVTEHLVRLVLRDDLAAAVRGEVEILV